MKRIVPDKIELKRRSRYLQLSYAHEPSYQLDFELLRVYSPSAEVRGHGNGEDAILQINKENVQIDGIEPVGNYAIKLVFDDGHDSGIYTWELLREFCLNKEALWQNYLKRLKDAGHTRLKQ